SRLGASANRSKSMTDTDPELSRQLISDSLEGNTMSIHTQILDNGKSDPAQVRQLIHDLYSGTLSDDEERALQPSLSGRYLTLEPLDGDDYAELDLFEDAEEHAELIDGFYGRSRTSGNDGWDALNFGFRHWFLLRTYGSDETEAEYVDPGDDLETFFQEKQR